MDTFRYGLALFTVLTVASALPWWFLIHPCAGFWRQVGTKWTYAVVHAGRFALLALLFVYRQPLLSIEWGTRPWLCGAGAALWIASGLVGAARRRCLSPRLLRGAAELAPAGDAQPLLSHGIYARMRHPRYVEVVLSVFGSALVTGHAAVWATALLTLLAVFLVVPLEEAELRARLGADYDAYCRRVPRYLPHR